MPLTRRPLRALRRHATLILGVCMSSGIVYLLLLGRYHTVAWEEALKEARQSGDNLAIFEAASRCIEQDGTNFDAYFFRALAASGMNMVKRAREDVDKAIELNPNNDSFIDFKSRLVASSGDFAGAVKLLDEAVASRPQQTGLADNAADMRIRYANTEQAKLLATLAPLHPERLRLNELFDSYVAAPVADGREFDEVVRGLPEGRQRTELGDRIQRVWRLLHEADLILGDVRASPRHNPRTSQLRAEVDVKFGRLLRAKEELQTLLHYALDKFATMQAKRLLVEVLRRSGAHEARAGYLREILADLGGEEAAGVFRVADVLEAEFDAAALSERRRQAWLRDADAHVAKHRQADLRTIGYRGIAALEWQKNPALAVQLLGQVYDSLRLQKIADSSVTDPARARLFMLTFLRACIAAGDIDRGLTAANTLLDLSPGDIELLRERGNLLRVQHRNADAASDFLAILRRGRRDLALFNQWIETASAKTDSAGKPLAAVAAEYAATYQDKLDQLKRKLREPGPPRDPRTRGGAPEDFAKEIAGIGQLEAEISQDPVIAWLMAEEFGRRGQTSESRNFLFKALTAEPEVLQFRFRYGQLRLDVGAYGAAAKEFQAVLDRDPSDVDAARYAHLAHRLNGDVAAARASRERAMLAAPTRGGLEFCILSCVESGATQRALTLLGPYLSRPDPNTQELLARVLIADGKFEPALAALARSRAGRPQDAEILQLQLVAQANSGKLDDFHQTVEEFVALPRLLPATDIEDTIAALEAKNLFAEAAQIASLVSSRYPEEVALRLRARAALLAFRGGDAAPLRSIVDEPADAARLDNDVVRAAFGLALRESGAAVAANFLQKAREYSDQRDWAHLPIAGAWSLSATPLDSGTFLSRYARAHQSDAIPADEVMFWWATRYRAASVSAEPQVPAGAEGELLWFKDNAGKLRDGTAPLDELYLRFLLFAFAGPGFERDATEFAQRIAKLDRRALTAARYVARRLAGEDAAKAVDYLLPRYQAMPSDWATFELLGDLMVRADSASDALQALAAEGQRQFPEHVEPLLFGAESALARSDHDACRTPIDAARALAPSDVRPLRLLARLALDSGDDGLGSIAARIVAQQKIVDPELRAFVLRRYAGRPDLEREGRLILSPLVAADPTFYDGALVLARALANSEIGAELDQLQQALLKAIPADPRAAEYGDTIAAISEILEDRGKRNEARQLLDAALLADPANVALRQRRAELFLFSATPTLAIDDLRLLCVLSPATPSILFNYGDVLLRERSDLSSLVADIMPTIATVSGDDPRYFALGARLRYLRADEIAQAGLQMLESLKRAPGRPDYWYFYGLMAFFGNDYEQMRLAFAKLPGDYPFVPRAQQLLALVKKS